MNTLEIKQAQPADVDALQAISEQTFIETFSAFNTEENMRAYLKKSFAIDQLTNELNNPYSHFYFAAFNNKIIGYIKVNVAGAQTELGNENALEIERIYVLKNHQGQHAGQALYNTALQLAKEANVDYVWLGVWEDNKKAIRFYEKNGFVAFDKHIFILGDDEQTDIMMKLLLVY